MRPALQALDIAALLFVKVHLVTRSPHPIMGGKEMLTLFRKFIFVSAFLTILFASAAEVASAQSDSSASQVPLTVTVTAFSGDFKPAPPIPQEDVTAYSDKTRLNIIRWVPAQGDNANLQLAILIDNDLGSIMLGRNIQDLEQFINSQPATTSVGIFYAENGAATMLAPFSTDHAEAAKSIRMTAGRQGGSPSIYLSLADLVQRWPSSLSARREVLVIASGFDPLYPGVEDPYADSAVDAAEKAAIDVHTILVPRAQYASTFRDNTSEGKLIQASQGTGGQVLFEGAFSPVSLSPFLDDLNVTLNNQYLLTLTIDRTKKKDGELRPFRIETEEHGIKLYAPKEILVPGP
jgi:hypothetical protein